MAGSVPRSLHGGQFFTKACVERAMRRPFLPLASISLAAQCFSFASISAGAAVPFCQASAHKAPHQLPSSATDLQDLGHVI